MWEHAADMFKAVFMGILGLLWWDIRKIRGERAKQQGEIDEKIDVKLTGYLKEDKHTDLCKIERLEQNAEFWSEIDKRFSDVKDIIIQNGKQ